jgi:nitrogen-specific signal transduction histidine kinase/CheY-like chemotaxis protein
MILENHNSTVYEDLRESEMRLCALSDNLPGGMVYQIDSGVDGQERKFTYVSAGVMQLHGISAAEAMADSSKIYNQVLEEDRYSVMNREAEALKCMVAFSVEVRCKLPSGEICWRRFTSAPRKLADKRIVWDGIEIDITEKQKLLEAARRADRIEAIGTLAGGIAHDFNNLLSGIYGSVDIALSAADPSQAVNHLKVCLSTIDRARGLTHQLLTFASGGAPNRAAGRFGPLIEEMTNFALSGSNISPVFDLQDTLWSCLFDRTQISQVIHNLVINARQAMPAGGNIEVKAHNVRLSENQHPVLKKGEYVEISVKDYGTGIPEEILKSIFDPFFTTKPDGRGLGLSTCYSIVTRHGGYVDVESILGKGSQFHVLLPASPNVFIQPESVSTIARYNGSGTVLIMDDEPVLRKTLGVMLETLGHQVEYSSNGEEAIELYAADCAGKGNIKAMIFDLTIANGMGGRAAVAEIRKRSKEIPVFVASGYAEDPIMANPREYGFTASICKPFLLSELSAMLKSHILIS